MKQFKIILESLLGGVLLTMIGAIGSLLYLMAGTSDTDERSYGFFGAVSFETQSTDKNSFMMNIGISSGWPLLFSIVVLTVFVYFFLTAYNQLRNRRKALSVKTG